MVQAIPAEEITTENLIETESIQVLLGTDNPARVPLLQKFVQEGRQRNKYQEEGKARYIAR